MSILIVAYFTREVRSCEDNKKKDAICVWGFSENLKFYLSTRYIRQAFYILRVDIYSKWYRPIFIDVTITNL